jgi:hypothetical protein
MSAPTQERAPSAQPNNEQRPDREKKRIPTWAKWVVGVTTPVVAAGIVTGELMGGSDDNQGNSPESASDAVPTLTVAATEAQQRFDNNRVAADQLVREGLAKHGFNYANYFNDGSKPASKDMTPKEILFRNTAEVQWIKTNGTEADVDLVAKPGTGPHSATISLLHSTDPTDHDSTDVTVPIGTPHRFSSGVHDGVDSHGHDTWEIANSSTTTSKNAVAVFEWEQNPNGGGEWVATETHSPDTDPDFNTRFSDLLH